MSIGQKSLTISILKAYNWHEKDSSDRYEFCFYSYLSKALILQKTIKTHISNNQLAINTSLKITYTSEESQILLKMSRINEDQSTTFINEFLIDLELLQEKRTQYLPFSKNDRILEVVCGFFQKDELKQKKPVLNNNKLDNFIQQKQVFLKSISGQNPSKFSSEFQSKQTFTQKLYALLQQTKKLRLKIHTQKKNPPVASTDNDIYIINKISEKMQRTQGQVFNQRLLFKSNSENLLTAPKNFAKSLVKTENDSFSNMKLITTRRCKLDLKSLTIIDPKDKQEYNEQIKQIQDEVLRSQQQDYSYFNANRQQYAERYHDVDQNR